MCCYSNHTSVQLQVKELLSGYSRFSFLLQGMYSTEILLIVCVRVCVHAHATVLCVDVFMCECIKPQNTPILCVIISEISHQHSQLH